MEGRSMNFERFISDQESKYHGNQRKFLFFIAIALVFLAFLCSDLFLKHGWLTVLVNACLVLFYGKFALKAWRHMRQSDPARMIGVIAPQYYDNNYLVLGLYYTELLKLIADKSADVVAANYGYFHMMLLQMYFYKVARDTHIPWSEKREILIRADHLFQEYASHIGTARAIVLDHKAGRRTDKLLPTSKSIVNFAFKVNIFVPSEVVTELSEGDLKLIGAEGQHAVMGDYMKEAYQSLQKSLL